MSSRCKREDVRIRVAGYKGAERVAKGNQERVEDFACETGCDVMGEANEDGNGEEACIHCAR